MAVAPFTRIVVDPREERKFIKRALRKHPLEILEALWGEVRGEILYICAFVKVDHKATRKTLKYEEEELDEHEEDAAEAGWKFLGTIHSHPNCDDNDVGFSEIDLSTMQDSQETVMAICAIQTHKIDAKTKVRKSLSRRLVRIAYWPTVSPLIAIHHVAAITTKKGRKLAKKKKSR